MTEPLACSVHPDAPFEGRCRRCGQPFCHSCLSSHEGVSLCTTCLGARRLRRVKILAVVSLMVGAPAALAAWVLHDRLGGRGQPTRAGDREGGGADTEARNALQARLGRAAHLARTGRAAEARSELGQILRIDPHHAGALHALALLDRQGGDWEAVLRSTGRILAKHPGAVETRRLQTEAFLSLGQPERAERALRDGLSAVPRSGALALALARLLAASGRRPEALGLLRDVIKRRPDSEEAAIHALLLSLEKEPP